MVKILKYDNLVHKIEKQNNFVNFQQFPKITHLPTILITKGDRFEYHIKRQPELQNPAPQRFSDS